MGLRFLRSSVSSRKISDSKSYIESSKSFKHIQYLNLWVLLNHNLTLNDRAPLHILLLNVHLTHMFRHYTYSISQTVNLYHYY